jgi:trans-aconitate methyltransferase
MQQTWDASMYAGNGRFVALLAESLIETLQPQAGERILDLGCGDGFLTRRIAESGATVVGVDSSPQMIAAATDRGLDARFASGEALPFDGEFDAVFSNAALHWMRDQDAVLNGVHRALKPGGPLRGRIWRAREHRRDSRCFARGVAPPGYRRGRHRKQ